jgi:hypothetical protein
MDNPSNTLSKTLAESRKLRQKSRDTIAVSKTVIDESAKQSKKAIGF